MALNFCNNNSLSAITSLPASISGGGLNLISTQTASSSSTISFTSGIDSTYKEYIFKFINIHPSTGSHLTFQGSTDSGSNYNTTITSSFFQAEVSESGSNDALGYQASSDQAQGTSFQRLFSSVSTNADDSGSGTLHLFEPSSTSFVKHFISTSNNVASAYTQNSFAAGYFNTTSAINAIQFKMSSGTIESGVVKLYGVS